MTAPVVVPVSALPWAVDNAREALHQARTVDPTDSPEIAGSHARLRETLATLIALLDARNLT